MSSRRRETALVVGGTALVAATYGLARFGLGLFLPEISRDVPVGSAAAGVVSAGGFVSYCLAAVVAVRAGRHPRALVVGAVATAGLGSLAVAAAGDVLVLAVAVLVAGAGAGMASPALVSLVARGVAPARRDDAQTVVNAGTGSGIVAAAGLLLVVGSSWRLGWVVVALVVVLAGAVTLLGATTAHPAAGPGGRQGPLRQGLGRPVLAAFLVGASSAATWTFGPTLLAGAGGGAGPVLAWTALGVGGVLGGTAGRLVARWSVERAWVVTAVATAAASGGLGLVAASPPAAYVVAGVFGASYVAASGVLILWAARGAAEAGADRTAVLFVALALGQAGGSAALGVALETVPVAVVSLAAAALGLLGALPATRPAPARQGWVIDSTSSASSSCASVSSPRST